MKIIIIIIKKIIIIIIIIIIINGHHNALKYFNSITAILRETDTILEESSLFLCKKNICSKVTITNIIIFVVPLSEAKLRRLFNPECAMRNVILVTPLGSADQNIHLQTVLIQWRRLVMSGLIWI